MSSSLGPSYRRLWTASALSNLADGIFQIALPLLALRLTRSPALIAGVSLAARLPWLVFALHAGAFADRLDRKRTMVRVDIARTALIGGLAVLVAVEHEALWILYVVAFALGIGETLFDTAAQSVMPSIVGRDDLSTANGRLYAVELTMNMFVGPPLGGILAAVAIAAAFGVSAACYAVAAVVLTLMTGSFKPQRTGEPVRIRTDIAEGLRYLWHHRVLRTMAFMVGVMNLASTATLALFPIYAVKPGPLGLSEAGFGILLTTAAVGSLVGSVAAPRIEATFGRARTLALCVVACGVPFVALAATSNVIAVGALFVVMGLGGVVWNVITVSLRQRIVPDHLLGRVNAGYRLLAWGTMPIGAALGGVLGELAGIRATFLLGGIATLLLLALRPIVTDRAIEEAEAHGDRDRNSAAPSSPGRPRGDEAVAGER